MIVAITDFAKGLAQQDYILPGSLCTMAEQIIGKLREAEIAVSQGRTQQEVARQIGVTYQTYCRWRKEYGGLRVDQAKRLKELEKQNAQLKRLLADAELDKSILKEAASGKSLNPLKKVVSLKGRQGNSRKRNRYHMKHLFNLCLAVGMTSAFNASAATLYSQTSPAEPSASFASSNITDRQKMADNFLVSGVGQYTVRSLRVIGTYGTSGNSPLPDDPNDNFRIVFLSDQVGIPSTPISSGDFTVSTAAMRSPTGGQLLGGTGRPIEFLLDLGDGVTLDHGTEYWLSISNNPLPGSGWAWARATGVFDSQLASTTGDVALGPWNVGLSNGMFFEIFDHNVPEPSSAVLLLVAAMPSALSRIPVARAHQYRTLAATLGGNTPPSAGKAWKNLETPRIGRELKGSEGELTKEESLPL